MTAPILSTTELKHAEAQCSALWSSWLLAHQMLHLGSTDVSSSVVTQKNIKVRLFMQMSAFRTVCFSTAVASLFFFLSVLRWRVEIMLKNEHTTLMIFHKLLIWASIVTNCCSVYYWVIFSFLFFLEGEAVMMRLGMLHCNLGEASPFKYLQQIRTCWQECKAALLLFR